MLAVIREAAESASVSQGPLHGYPPWLIVLLGALVLAIVIWIFTKLVKVALWMGLLVVLVGGLVIAGKMLLGQ